jgi:urate oxidase
MPTSEPIRLGPTSYGKSVVRLVKVIRNAAQHELHDLTVDIALHGDFAGCFERGDNTSMPATDTLRNTVYAFAKHHPLDEIESFGIALASHFRTISPLVTGATVSLTEHPWERISINGQSRDHAFTRAAGERTANIRATSDSITVEAGIDSLLVLKTTASGWEGFHRDQYTTLPDANDRILATSITARWSYGQQTNLPFGDMWRGVRECILATFGDHYSPSVQHTIYRMGRAVLESFPQIERIHFSLPNKHYLLYNLAPFGLENPGEIFHVTSDPFGLIEGTIERQSERARV